jgi:hypothetical protein
MKVMQAHELTCKINGSGTAIDCDCYLSRIPKGVLTASGQAQVAVPPKPASTRATAGEQSEPIKALNPLFDSNLAVPSKGEGLDLDEIEKFAVAGWPIANTARNYLLALCAEIRRLRANLGDNGGSEASPKGTDWPSAWWCTNCQGFQPASYQHKDLVCGCGHIIATVEFTGEPPAPTKEPKRE